MAFFYIRKIGLPHSAHCCCREGLGWEESSEVAREGWPGLYGAAGSEAGVAPWGGTGSEGQCALGGWVGGRSDVGLGVDGACWESTRQGAAAGQADPSGQALVSSCRAAQGRQLPFESWWQKFCYC